jgi:hypothetical protein
LAGAETKKGEPSLAPPPVWTPYSLASGATTAEDAAVTVADERAQQQTDQNATSAA